MVKMKCLNKDCTHHFKDNCVLALTGKELSINEDGECETFEAYREDICKMYCNECKDYTNQQITPVEESNGDLTRHYVCGKCGEETTETIKAYNRLTVINGNVGT